LKLLGEQLRMLAALPLISWLGITAAFYFRLEKADSLLNGRRAFLAASVVRGMLLTLFTELLSIILGLRPAALISVWSGTAVTVLLVLLLLARERRGTRHSWQIGLSRFDLFSCGSATSIVLATGVIAFAAPPNGAEGCPPRPHRGVAL